MKLLTRPSMNFMIAEVRGDVVSRAGWKKKHAALCKNTAQLMGNIIKQCLRTEQETKSLCGAIFDTIIMALRRSERAWENRRVGTTRESRQRAKAWCPVRLKIRQQEEQGNFSVQGNLSQCFQVRAGWIFRWWPIFLETSTGFWWVMNRFSDFLTGQMLRNLF